jgi:hypothetical protein
MFQSAAEQFQIVGNLAVGLAQFINFAHAMHDRGVIALAEFAANFRQAATGQTFAQPHGDLTWTRQCAGAFWSKHIGQTDVEMFRDFALDFFNCELAIRCAQDVGQAVLRHFNCDGAADQRRERIESSERALHDTHVAGNAVRQKFQHARCDFNARIDVNKHFLLGMQDAKAQFIVCWVQIDHKAALQTGFDAF